MRPSRQWKGTWEMGKLAVLAMAAALAAAPGWAEAQTQAPRAWTTDDPEGRRGRFEFLGQRLGDPVDKAFPDWKNQKDQFGALLCQTTIGLPGFLDCAYQGLRTVVDGVPRHDYGGVEVKFVNLRYVDRKLVGFTMGFDAKVFPALAAVLARQFGRPFATETLRWKDRLGLEYDTAVHVWNTPHGEMTLKERWVHSDSGMLKLIEPAAERRYQDLRYRQVVVE
jgi:hypothetical protein